MIHCRKVLTHCIKNRYNNGMNTPRLFDTPSYLRSLSEKIVSKRRERGGRLGISLRVAAKEIDIEPVKLSRIERGATPDLPTFRKLCVWLGESADDLLGLNKEIS